MKKPGCKHLKKLLVERFRSDGFYFYIELCISCGKSQPVKKKSLSDSDFKMKKYFTNDDYDKLKSGFQNDYYNRIIKPYIDYKKSNSFIVSEYQEYIKSDKWKLIRNIRMEYDDYLCQNCYDNAYAVHHITYQRLGKEKLGDLISLCSICHEVEHTKINKANKYYEDLQSNKFKSTDLCFPLDCKIYKLCHKFNNIPKYYENKIKDLNGTNFCPGKKRN